MPLRDASAFAYARMPRCHCYAQRARMLAVHVDARDFACRCRCLSMLIIDADALCALRYDADSLATLRKMPQRVRVLSFDAMRECLFVLLCERRGHTSRGVTARLRVWMPAIRSFPPGCFPAVLEMRLCSHAMMI